MDQATTQFIAGALVALVPVLLWELGIRPWRTRRNVMRMLLAELRINLVEMGDIFALRQETPKALPQNLNFPHVVFDATGSDLGELDAKVLFKVLECYSVLVDVQRAVDTVSEFIREIQGRKGANEEKMTALVFKGQQILTMNIDIAISRLVKTIDLLNEATFNDWGEAAKRQSPEEVKRAAIARHQRIETRRKSLESGAGT